MRTRVPSLPLLSGLRIWHCHELWCRSHMWLGSGLSWAVVQVLHVARIWLVMSRGTGLTCGSDLALLLLWHRPTTYSSDSIPRLETSICLGCGPKKETKKKKKESPCSVLSCCRSAGSIPSWHIGLRIWCCWSCGSDSVPGLGTSICCGYNNNKKLIK